MAPTWYGRSEQSESRVRVSIELARGAACEAVDHRLAGVEDLDAFGLQSRNERSVFEFAVVRLFTKAVGERKHDDKGALTPGLGQFGKGLAYGGHQSQPARGMIRGI